MATKTELLKENISDLVYGLAHQPPNIDAIVLAFNQWLEEQKALHQVKCPHCSYSQFCDRRMGISKVVGMSPCYWCSDTGYILEPLRLEVKDGTAPTN